MQYIIIDFAPQVNIHESRKKLHEQAFFSNKPDGRSNFH